MISKDEANAAFNVVQDAINKAVMGQLPIGIAAAELHAEILRALKIVGGTLQEHFKEEEDGEAKKSESQQDAEKMG